jgi:hypothetical protein
LIKGASEGRTAETELYDLIEDDPTLSAIMHDHHATRDDLQKIYWALMSAGAGQWTRGHWVAASALCYGFTLEFVLKRLGEVETTTKTPREIWLSSAFQLVEYFEKGRVGRL